MSLYKSSTRPAASVLRITLSSVLTLLVAVGAATTARAVVTGTVVTNGRAVLDAVVRLDVEIAPPPVTAAHNRSLDPNPVAGDVPLVARTGLNGKLEVSARPELGQKFLVSVGHEEYRSAEIAAGSDAALGEIKTEASEQCVRISLDGGKQWVCEQDRWRYAQPSTGRLAVADADTPVRPRPDELSAQWALKKIGLSTSIAHDRLAPVIVAVIDSGLDYAHPHLKPENIWRNPVPGGNPAYPNDVIGWDFVTQTNQPWDDYGHGTFVAGLILTINPAARIMPLKVLDKFGGGRASSISAAVVYAVDHGARVLNLSLGSKGLSQVEQLAVNYARSKGAVVVVAAGNEGIDTAAFGLAGLEGVITVAATDPNDKKPPFGNWGQHVSLAAPGVDIVSLRARASDLILATTGGKDYTAGANIVGHDRWFFRATGTSFAAPLVAGAASLLLARTPTLTNEQIERILVESADDVEVAGWDQFTGAGRLNIARALQADPDYFLVAKITRIAPAREGGQAFVKVFGTAIGSRLERYEIQLGRGTEPSNWKTVAFEQARSVDGDLLARIPIREITSKGKWTVRLIVTDAIRKTKESRGTLNVE